MIGRHERREQPFTLERGERPSRGEPRARRLRATRRRRRRTRPCRRGSRGRRPGRRRRRRRGRRSATAWPPSALARRSRSPRLTPLRRTVGRGACPCSLARARAAAGSLQRRPRNVRTLTRHPLEGAERGERVAQGATLLLGEVGQRPAHRAAPDAHHLERLLRRRHVARVVLEEAVERLQQLVLGRGRPRGRRPARGRTAGRSAPGRSRRRSRRCPARRRTARRRTGCRSRCRAIGRCRAGEPQRLDELAEVVVRTA